MCNPSFLRACRVLLVARVLSADLPHFQHIQLVQRNETDLGRLLNPHRLHLQVLCSAPCPSRCMMALALLLSVQTSILNGLAVWCSNRCFTYNASMQPFLIAMASNSAEDSDMVACVTDQHSSGDVEHLVFGSPAQSASTVTWMTSSSFRTQGYSVHIADVL